MTKSISIAQKKYSAIMMSEKLMVFAADCWMMIEAINYDGNWMKLNGVD